MVASHARVWDRIGQRVPRSDGPRRPSRKHELAPEEKALLEEAPELSCYVQKLKTHGRGLTTLALRRLLSMVCDYPRSPLLAAFATAEQYGLFDLERVERMVLKRIAGDYFNLLPDDAQGDPHE
jgi:hypothetical protein